MDDVMICRFCLREIKDCGGNCAGEGDQKGLTMKQAAERLRRMAQLIGITVGEGKPDASP